MLPSNLSRDRRRTCAAVSEDEGMIVFNREKAADVFDEIEPLTLLHENEVRDAIIDEFPLKINRTAYQRLDDLGILRVFTVRDDGVLVGYVIFMVCRSLRRDGLKIAQEDALYLHPDYRKAGNAVKLINYVTGELAAECQLVTYHSPMVNPRLGTVLMRMGYIKHSEYFTRRL